jgi:N-methylhydantoinase A
MLRIAVDIGGTFTDVTVFDELTGEISLGKVLSTPQDLVEGIMEGIKSSGASVEQGALIIHGSTVVINALLERKGVPSALLTTKGFKDVYEIGRINRPDSFNLRFQKHKPLITRENRYEINERLDAAGNVLVALQEDEVKTLATELAQEVQSVAVVLLHSYQNPVNERRIKEIFKETAPNLFVTTSHEISREYREYERTSTTAANAYVGPLVSSYIERLEQHLTKEGFNGSLLIMQSNGGLMDSQTATNQCIQMLESGPAGGVTGTKVLADELNIANAIAFDMGGTTAKACVIENGIPRMSSDYFVGEYGSGLSLRIPVIDIKEVGTGGGSLAWIDQAGGLHVGPMSAGAEPGPVSYDRGGTEPAVTDANVVLGRIGANQFLGGKMNLNVNGAREAISTQIAGPTGISIEEAAIGIVRIAETSMAYAVRAVTTERGLDPRDFVLFAYGGGGPLHAVAVAKELNIPKVIIPPVPGLFSARSMLQADLRRDVVRTCFIRLNESALQDIEALYSELEQEALLSVQMVGISQNDVHFIRSVDMRYVGQEHTVTIDIPNSIPVENRKRVIKDRFDEAHEIRYNHSAPEEEAEIVSLRVAAMGVMNKPILTKLEQGYSAPPESSQRPNRNVIFYDPNNPVDCPVYDRSRLLAGNRIEGPAVIEEDTCTTLLPKHASALIGEYGQILIEVSYVE